MKRYLPVSPQALFWLIVLLYTVDMIGSFFLGFETWSWPQRGLVLATLGLTTLAGTLALRDFLQRPPKTELSISLQTKVLDTLRDGVVLSDLTGNIYHTNQAFQHLSGYTAQELMGQQVTMLLPDPGLLDTQRAISEVLSGRPVARDWPLQRKDGQVLYTSSSAQLLTDEETGEQYVLGIVRDVTDLQASQQALQQERNRFEFFVESLPHLMWTYGPTGEIDYVNDKARKMLWGTKSGIEPPVPETEWYRYLHPGDFDRVMTQYAKVDQSDQPYAFEARLWDADSQGYRWFSLQGAPLKDEQGKVVKWYGTGTDIGPLMQVQAQLQDRERLYRSLVESQGTFVMRTDLAGHFIYANPALVARFYPDRQVLGKKAIDLAHPEDVEQIEEVGQACLAQTGIRRDLLARKRQPDGQWVHIAWEFICLRDDAGEVFFQAIGRDVTTEIKAQEALEAEKKNFEFFVESLPHIMWRMDEQRNVTYLNRKGHETYGLPFSNQENDLAKVNWIDMVHPDDRDLAINASHNLPEQNQPISFNLRLKHAPSDSYRWFRLHRAPKLDAEGKVISWYGTCTDIDAMVKFQQQLNDRERLYRSLVESQSTLVMRLYVGGIYVYANAALRKKFYSGETVVGRQSLALVHPDDIPVVKATSAFCQQHPGARRYVRLRKRLPDGTWATTEWEFMCLLDDKGELFLQGIGRDITAQVQSEIALEVERKRFEFFVEFLPHIMLVGNPQGQVVFINRAGRERFGLPADADATSFKQVNWVDMVHLDDQDIAAQVIETSIQGHQVATCRFRMYDVRHRVYRWFQLHQAPQFDEEGQLMFSYGTLTDIHELIETQQRLYERERFYRSLVESQSLYFTQTHQDGRLRYANSAYAQRFFPSPLPLDYQTGELVHPDDVELAEVAAKKCSQAPGKPVDLILRQRTISGEWVYVEWELMHFSETEGASTVYYFQAIGKDITERYQQEQERRALAMIVEQLDHGVMMTDHRFHIQWINRAMEKMTQYSLSEIEGCTVAEIFSGPMTSEETVARIQKNLENLQPTITQLIKYDRTGRPYWAEVSVQPIANEAGKVASAFTLERDITESKMRSQELERTAQELTRRNERLNDFTYMVSHNVRAPLANLKGMGDLLMEEIEPTPANQQMLDFFRKAINRLQMVIEGMEHSLESNQQEEARQEVSLLELFRYIVEQLQLDVDAAEVTWEIDFSGAQVLMAPWTYLYNILYNLISNALKYREPRRKLEIEIASYQADGQTIILVRDNGQGMDLEAIGDRLFKRGERFHDHTEGTGTGLYLVQQQMERLGGRIEVSSHPGKGTAFWLFFPQ